MKKIFLSVLFFLFVFIFPVSAQSKKSIISGPMLGHTELRTATVWVQFAKEISTASIYYRAAADRREKFKSQHLKLSGDEFNTIVFTLTGLEPGTSYQYYISAGTGKKYLDSGTVTTQNLWQSRNPPPSFTFLAGSCSYFNQPEYDRSGKPYGGDSSIFLTMAKEKSDFMIWLGDNWYTRPVDYYSEWGLHYRASHDRQQVVLKNFLRAMPHYAIWDDHDYGPNDADKSYVLKTASRKVFMKYWANPSYGMNDEGIYTRFSYNDADFFLLDGRWNRSNDQMKDSVNNAPDKEKKMFGDEQMEWLKNALLMSAMVSATKFRIIVTGSQILNQYSRWDAFRKFHGEYTELLSFLEENKINGVIFITGDRHHSEVIRLNRNTGYPLHDITVSPLSAGPAKTSGAEMNNAGRVSQEIAEQNYGRFSVSGEGKERRLTVEFISIDGKIIDTWSALASELSF